LDFSKVRTGEITAALGGAALFVFLFFDWVDGVSGWDYLGIDVTGFIVFLAAITGITLGLLAALERRTAPFGWVWGGPTTVLGVLAFDIVIWRMFANGEADLAVGIFLGLIAAAALVVGGYMTLQDGGRDPLGLGGGTATAPTRAATASRSSTTTRKKTAAKRKPAAKRRAAR
jgi:hypothetical protein